MTRDEINAGESETLEFKEQLPDDHKKYIKTLVAFANQEGGLLVIGVRDNDRAIVGVPEDDVATMKDAIANAVHETVSSSLPLRVVSQVFDEKTVVIAEVSRGPQRPYYIKKEGIDKGTYVRYGATTQQADPNTLQRLIREGNNTHYDQQMAEIDGEDAEITEQQARETCKALNDFALSHRPEASAKPLGLPQLISWKLVIKRKKALWATNAYCWLVGHWAFPYAKICCVSYQGRDKAVAMKSQDIDGPVHEQIDQAYQFILNQLSYNTQIDRLVRTDSPEIPEVAIREALANAVVHRDYSICREINVSVFSDRLEIDSPGALPSGIDTAHLHEGLSLPCNPSLAEAFKYLGLIEKWGSGIGRIRDALRESNLPDAIYDNHVAGYRSSLRVTIKRFSDQPTPGASSGKSPQTEPKGRLEQAILRELSKSPTMTQKALAEQLAEPVIRIKRTMKKMQEGGLLRREGGRRGGSWVLSEPGE